MFVSRNVCGHYEGWIRRYFGHYFGLYSGSTKVLQGCFECIERLLNSGIGREDRTPRRFLRSTPEYPV